MQDWGWMVSPHLIYGIWSSQFFTETRIRVIKSGETCKWTNVKFVQHLTQFKNGSNLMEWSMIWTLLILFPQTSILLIRKLCCMCLKTTKQWSRWSWREEARQWDTYPEPTELLLIGCSIESIWTPRSKSNTSTPETISQTNWQMKISHVMNGIIFYVCSTSAISVPSIVLKWCRKERKRTKLVRQSKSPEYREIVRRFARGSGSKITRGFSRYRCERQFRGSFTWRTSTSPKHVRSQKGSWETGFHSCSVRTQTEI